MPSSTALNPVRLIVIRNPFDRRERDERVVSSPVAQTVDALVGEYLPAGCAEGTELVVSINGAVVPQEEWTTRQILPGDQMVALPVVRGGGGGILGSVLSIAMMVIAPEIAAFAYGEIAAAGAGAWLTSFEYTLFSGAISMVGSALIGALIAPDQPNLPSTIGATPSGGSYDTSPSYGWNPVTTQEPGGVVARAYGKVKLHGNIISGYIENTGDTGREQVAHMLIDLGIGPYSTLSDFKINSQPISYYSSVSVETRLGELDQSIISGFNDTYINHSFSSKVVNGAPVTRATAGSDFNAFELVIVCPHGLWYSNDQGGLNEVSVSFDVELSSNGGVSWSSVGSYTLSAASQQPVRKTVRVDNCTRGLTYTVRVSNNTADQTSSRYGDDLYLTELNEVLYDDFTYPRTVLTSIRALATDQLSGGMQFECLADAAIVQVWNGSAWTAAFSRNPAWVAWDILTQPVYNNSHSVVRYDGFEPSRLDLADFYAWAQWCDTAVPVTGGTEPRCVFDGVYDTQSSMWDAALEVAASARATLLMRGTTVTVVYDRVRSLPSQVFSVGNTSINSFQETFLSMVDRACTIEVDFLDAEQDHARDKITIVNTGVTESAAQRVQFSNRGIRRASQAWREAMFRLKRNELLRRCAEIGVDIDALACTVGDLIWVQNDVTQWGEGGRIVSGTTMTLVLDKSITLASGKTYDVVLRAADDTISVRRITTAAGTVSSVTVSSAFPAPPIPYDIWAIGETGKTVKEFLVTDIRRNSDQLATLSLIEYNASLYNVDVGAATVPTPNIASGAGTITGIVVSEVLEHGIDGGIYVRLDLNYHLNGATAIEAWLSGDGGGTWIANRRTAPDVASWYAVVSGQQYRFAYRPIDYFGKPVNEWQYLDYTVIGKLAPPADVTGFHMSVSGANQALLVWDIAIDLDVIYGGQMLLRHSPLLTGATWGTAIDLPPAGGMATNANVPLLYGTYLAKWVDSTGHLSANAAIIETDIAAAMSLNTVFTQTEETAWTGTKSSCVVETGKLTIHIASGIVEPCATYAVPRIDLGVAYLCRAVATIPVTAYATGNNIDDRLSLTDTWESLDGAVRDATNVQLWMRSTPSNPSISGDWGPFQPHPISADVYGRAFDFELRMYSYVGDQNVFIDAMSIVIDMPDRVEAVSNATYTSGTLAITFAKPYFVAPTIGITGQNMATGDYYTVTSKSTTGFSIRFKNAAGADVARTFDWFATGY